VSYLDHIERCNAWQPGHFVPFTVDGLVLGRVKPAFAARLAAFPEVFVVDADGVALAPGVDGFEARSAAVEGALRALEADGAVAGWRGENYPVATSFAAPPLFQMERAAVPLMGVRSYGVHVNGFVRRDDGIHMWIGRRARDKATFPGMLDNFVAGGQPIGIGLMDNLIKEAAEEAGVPRAIAVRAVPVGAITYCMETEDGLKPDVQFAYDLELPADFTPQNTDGELEEFYLWPVERVMAVTRDTREFKFNCNLINIDFFVRHGLIQPDDPDYLDILAGLHR
jgi:8-oxo-dGTP pyrophosphatase MutT (NUDIX family)